MGLGRPRFDCLCISHQVGCDIFSGPLYFLQSYNWPGFWKMKRKQSIWQCKSVQVFSKTAHQESFFKTSLRKMNVLKNKSYTRQWEYGLLSSLHCVKLTLWSVSVSGTSSISEWRNRNVWLCGLNTDIKQQFLLCIWIRLHGVNNTLSNNVLLWCNTMIRLCNSYTF